jgi:hypothetical protein
MITLDVGELEFAESPRDTGRTRRAVVILVTAALAVAVLAIVGATLVQGSWWYSYPTDQPLDDAARAHLATIQEALVTQATAPEAVALLELASTPGTDPSTVRAYLVDAQEALEAIGDPGLAALIADLQSIIIDIRPQGEESTRAPFTPELDGP